MHRLQLTLEGRHYQFLHLRALVTKTTLSATIRSIIEKEMASAKSAVGDPISEIIGAFQSGHRDTAKHAEEILY